MAIENLDYVKLVCEFLLPDDVIAQNVFYFIAKLTGTQQNGDVRDALESWVEVAYSELLLLIPNDVTVRPFKVSQIEFDAGLGYWEVIQDMGTFTPDVVFTGGDDPLPNATAVTTYFPTNRPKTRGRKALPVFTETMLVDNNLSTAAATAVAAWLSEILDDPTIDVDNYFQMGVPRKAVSDFKLIQSGAANTVVGSMRSRKPGVGI